MKKLWVLYKRDEDNCDGYDGIVAVFANIPDVKTIVKLCGVNEYDAGILIEELSMRTTDDYETDYFFIHTKYFE